MSPLLFNLYTECLISRIVNSGIGCHIGKTSAAILMYADDIALLAPSRGSMQQLLNICNQFGNEFKLSFNAQKSECIVFGGKTTPIDLKLNGNCIPYVNNVKYLGHNLHNNSINSIFNLYPLISDMKTRTNVILSNFKFLSFDAKIKIFNANCSSFYGSVLSNQADNSLEVLDRSWRVCCRRLLSLPPRAHCNLIPPMMGTLPPSKQINKRTVTFFIKGLMNNSFLNYIFNNCIYEKSSVMYRNLNKISHDLNITIKELLSFNNCQIKKIHCVNDNWKSNFLKELMYCREGQFVSNFSRHEIDHVLNHILLF